MMALQAPAAALRRCLIWKCCIWCFNRFDNKFLNDEYIRPDTDLKKNKRAFQVFCRDTPKTHYQSHRNSAMLLRKLINDCKVPSICRPMRSMYSSSVRYYVHLHAGEKQFHHLLEEFRGQEIPLP
jgi:hypothetical protein